MMRAASIEGGQEAPASRGLAPPTPDRLGSMALNSLNLLIKKRYEPIGYSALTVLALFAASPSFLVL